MSQNINTLHLFSTITMNFHRVSIGTPCNSPPSSSSDHGTACRAPANSTCPRTALNLRGAGRCGQRPSLSCIDFPSGIPDTAAGHHGGMLYLPYARQPYIHGWLQAVPPLGAEPYASRSISFPRAPASDSRGVRRDDPASSA